MMPKACQQVTVSTGDLAMTTYFAAGIARRVIPQASGTVFLQLAGDAAALSYVATAGVPIDGEIILVGGSTNYPSASAIVLNLQL
jgi:hypothetical protein